MGWTRAGGCGALCGRTFLTDLGCPGVVVISSRAGRTDGLNAFLFSGLARDHAPAANEKPAPRRPNHSPWTSATGTHPKDSRVWLAGEQQLCGSVRWCGVHAQTAGVLRNRLQWRVSALSPDPNVLASPSNLTTGLTHVLPRPERHAPQWSSHQLPRGLVRLLTCVRAAARRRLTVSQSHPFPKSLSNVQALFARAGSKVSTATARNRLPPSPPWGKRPMRSSPYTTCALVGNSPVLTKQGAPQVRGGGLRPGLGGGYFDGAIRYRAAEEGSATDSHSHSFAGW